MTPFFRRQLRRSTRRDVRHGRAKFELGLGVFSGEAKCGSRSGLVACVYPSTSVDANYGTVRLHSWRLDLVCSCRRGGGVDRDMNSSSLSYLDNRERARSAGATYPRSGTLGNKQLNFLAFESQSPQVCDS